MPADAAAGARTSVHTTVVAVVLTIVAAALVAVDSATLLWFPAATAAALVILYVIQYIDRRPEYMLVLLVGAATLDVSGRLLAVGPLKLTVYQALAAIALLYTARRLKDGESRFLGTPLDLPILVYVVLVFVSIVSAISPSIALVQSVSLLSSVLLTYLVVILADSPSRLRTVVAGVLIVATGIGILGILENFKIFTITGYLLDWGSQTIRSTATFKDPNIMGSFQMTAIALALPLLLTTKDRWKRLAYLAGLLVAGMGLATTASRGALGALFIAVFVILLVIRVRISMKLVVVALVGTLLVATLFFVASPEWFENRVLNVAQDNSAMSRVYMGESALQMARENPLGIGMGNYAELYPFYRSVLVRSNLVESHTAYLTILVETGVLGLLMFAIILVRFAYLVWRTARAPGVDRVLHACAVGALAAMVGLAAQAFTYSLESSKFWWLALGVGLAAEGISRTQRAESIGSSPARTVGSE
jgi:O-antigen ligase